MNRRIGGGNMARALAGGLIAGWIADALAPTAAPLRRGWPLPLSLAPGLHAAAPEEFAPGDVRGLVTRTFPRARDRARDFANQ